MVLAMLKEPGPDDSLADSEILPALLFYARVRSPALGTDDNNIEIFGQEWQDVVHLGNVVQKVDDVSAILVLLATDLRNLDKAMYAGNEHLLDLAELGEDSRTRYSTRIHEVAGGEKAWLLVEIDILVNLDTATAYIVSVEVHVEPLLLTLVTDLLLLLVESPMEVSKQFYVPVRKRW
jgi:hypothetical protein